jgi:hypothetical protein
MIFINPWTYYQIHEPDKIPDLNPHNDKEVVGCLAGVCGFIISSIIFALVIHLSFSITINEYINRNWLPLLMFVNYIVIYPILTILLMKLSFKIAEKITIKNKKK